MVEIYRFGGARVQGMSLYLTEQILTSKGSLRQAKMECNYWEDRHIDKQRYL